MADFFTILNPEQFEGASVTGLSSTSAEVGAPLSNLLTNQPREIFKTDGTSSALGLFSFDVDFGQKILFDQVALLFHNGRRNGWISVKTADTQAGLASPEEPILFSPLQTQLDQLFIDIFDNTSDWTLINAPTFVVANRIATLTQVTTGELEDAKWNNSLPATGILMIDFLDTTIETGIVIGGSTSSDTYVRITGSSKFQARTGDNVTLREDNTDAALGKRWEFHLRATDFDFLVDGKVVFLQMPRSGNELRLRTEGASAQTTRFRLLQIFSNTINDFFERNHFFASIPPVDAKWARIFIDHNNGADAFFSAGRLLFGKSWTPSANTKMEMGFSLGALDASPRQTRRDQGIVVSSRTKPSRFQGSIITRGGLDEDSEPEIFNELDEIVRKRGGNKPILLALEPASILRRHKKLFYGLAESRLLQSTLATGSIKRYKYSLTVEEMT